MPVSFKKSTVKAAAEVAAPVTEADLDDIPFDLEDSAIDVATDTPLEVSEVNVGEGPATAPAEVSKYSHHGTAAKAKWDKAEDDTQIPFRYRMKVGEVKKITFLDGDLDESGFFKNVSLFEHTMQVGNNYPTYVCTENCPDPKDNEPCPCCLQSGRQPYMVCFFTVIDHTGYTNKQGKVVKDITRVFAAKRRTMSILMHIAAKHGGLAGVRFDVMRLEGHANTGETFEFVKKFPVQALCDKYKTAPIDPARATNYKSRQELLLLGFGGVPIGAESLGAVSGSDINVDEDL